MKAKDQAIAVRIREMKEHSNSFWVWSIFLQLTNYTPMSLQPPEPNPVGATGFRWKSCINLIIITLTQLPVCVCDFCVYKHNKKELPPYKLVSTHMIWDMRYASTWYEIRIPEIFLLCWNWFFIGSILAWYVLLSHNRFWVLVVFDAIRINFIVQVWREFSNICGLTVVWHETSYCW